MEKEKDFIQSGDFYLEYWIIFSQRKTLAIYVYPDQSVMARVPFYLSKEKVRSFVLSKIAWIKKKMSFYASLENKISQRSFEEDNTYLYLGKSYKLHVIPDCKNKVQCQTDNINIFCRKQQDVGSLLMTWYRQQAIIIFHEIANPLIDRFKRYGVEPSSIVVRMMKTKWGSCSSTGKITLNTALIRAPRICIEYVIIHELCHLIHFNHGKEFYALLTREMPDWKTHKLELNKIII